jgi:hypothetical protein
VHLGGGEAGEPGLLQVGDRVGLVRLGRAPGALGELEGALRDCAQLRTPTWTLRKRPAEVPCDTCACWPGWPLPQFVSP